MARKRQSTGQTIGAIIAGFDQQIFRTTPPAHELVAKGKPLAPVPAQGGGTLTIGFEEAEATTGSGEDTGLLSRRTGRPGDRGPHAWRPAGLARRRRPRDPDHRRHGSHVLGLVPDGPVRGPGSRRTLLVPRPAVPAADRDAAACHPRHGPGSVVGSTRRPDDRDGARTRLAVRGTGDPAVRARRGSLHLPARASRRRADAGFDGLASVVPTPAGRRGRWADVAARRARS